MSPKRLRKPKHRPTTDGFAGRLADLRAMLPEDHAAAGDQALKLIEEYLQSLSEGAGYAGDGSLRRYAQFLRGFDVLPAALLDQTETYAEARNCLAHTYGLQTSPAFAAELIEFAAELLKQVALTAAQLMTRDLRTVAATASLADVRALVVRGGYGRLPVVGRSGRIIGLLTERDLVVAQAVADHGGPPLAGRTAADLLPADGLDRLGFAAPDDSRDAVVEHLRRPGVVACLVTPGGDPEARPLGIITHADLLYRM